MELIFILYTAYKNPNNKRLQNIQFNSTQLPNYFASINEHWDSSCRPDPDFHPDHPSTGICRNKRNGGIQQFLSGFVGNSQHLVFYFYPYQGNVIISAALQVVDYHSNHHKAYAAYSKHGITHVNMPLNIISAGTPPVLSALQQNYSYSGCINNRLVPGCSCKDCIDGYYKRMELGYIEYKWYIGNGPTVLFSVKEDVFRSQLQQVNGRLTSGGEYKPGNNFGSLQNGGVVVSSDSCLSRSVVHKNSKCCYVNSLLLATFQ